MKTARISKGGQVTVPAEVRKRWGTTNLLVEDHGDAIVFRTDPGRPDRAPRWGRLRDRARPPTRCGRKAAPMKTGSSADDFARSAGDRFRCLRYDRLLAGRTGEGSRSSASLRSKRRRAPPQRCQPCRGHRQARSAVKGTLFDDVLERLIWLAAGGLEIVDTDFEVGAFAGFLRATHYRRKDNALSTADCHALATALVLEDSLATSDPALAATARYEDVTVIALPDSTGRRPSSRHVHGSDVPHRPDRSAFPFSGADPTRATSSCCATSADYGLARALGRRVEPPSESPYISGAATRRAARKGAGFVRTRAPLGRDLQKHRASSS